MVNSMQSYPNDQKNFNTIQPNNIKDSLNKDFNRTDTNLASQLRRSDKERLNKVDRDRTKHMTPNRYDPRHQDKHYENINK